MRPARNKWSIARLTLCFVNPFGCQVLALFAIRMWLWLSDNCGWSVGGLNGVGRTEVSILSDMLQRLVLIEMTRGVQRIERHSEMFCSQCELHGHLATYNPPNTFAWTQIDE